MRIDCLRVQNFRGFAEQKFTFHPCFNVFIGQNGTGKSALLSALNIAIGTWLLGVNGGSAYNSKGIEDNDIHLQGLANPSTGFPNFEERGTTDIEAEGEVSPFGDAEQLSWGRRKRGRGGVTRSHHERLKMIAQEAIEASQRDNTRVTLPVLAYYSTERLYYPDAWKEKMPESARRGGYHKCLDGRIRISHFRSWMKVQDRQMSRTGEASVMYDLLREKLADLLPGVRDVGWMTAEDEKDDDVYVQFEEGYGPDPESKVGSYVKMRHLSDGYRTTLGILGDLAVRMIRLNSRDLATETLLQTPGVVLIDELDLHLHPKWQRRIVESLKDTFPRVQFITTTHSLFIVQSLEQGEVYSLEGDQLIPNIQNKDLDTIADGLMGLQRQLKAFREEARTGPDTEMVQQYRDIRDSTLEQIRMMDNRMDFERDLDAVAEKVMHVSNAETSRRYQAMKESALEYLKMLDERDNLEPGEKLEVFKERLADKIAPYADNPAYQAFLERKRTKELGE